MHALLLTLIALGAGPDGAYAAGRITQSSADIYHASAGHSSAGMSSGCNTCGQGTCGGHSGGHRFLNGERVGGWFGHMPQTCYDPRYGCYQGSGRFMNRYPAFHGTYYRRPYNYRNVFDYPWHAELHEPTSLFSYNTPPESGASNIQDIGSPEGSLQPTPTPMFESARRLAPATLGSGVPARGDRRLPNAASAHVSDRTSPRANPIHTLRR